MPASPAGTVPQAWPIVLRLALTARPGLAVSGLAALLRGKKLRAWNRLCLAAAQHPTYYAMSIKAAEAALFPAPSATEPGRVGAIIVGGDSAVYCAQATLVHHESRSPGQGRRGADLARFERELSVLRARWSTVVAPDHSPLFRRQSERCLLAF
jgi:hypothetical protein